MEFRITVPMPPNISNGSHGHWTGRHANKKAYWKALDLLQSIAKIPEPPVRPLDRVKLSSTMYLGGAMDDDNAMRRHKWVLDWLKTRGYIANDAKRNVTWTGLPRQVRTGRDGERKIELVLAGVSAVGGKK